MKLFVLIMSLLLFGSCTCKGQKEGNKLTTSVKEDGTQNTITNVYTTDPITDDDDDDDDESTDMDIETEEIIPEDELSQSLKDLITKYEEESKKLGTNIDNIDITQLSRDFKSPVRNDLTAIETLLLSFREAKEAKSSTKSEKIAKIFQRANHLIKKIRGRLSKINNNEPQNVDYKTNIDTFFSKLNFRIKRVITLLKLRTKTSK